MSNLKPLFWDWSYGDGGKTNAVCRAKSPSHEYIIRIEAGGEVYVDYRKFDNDEDSDNRKDEPPVFDSVAAAQEWVQSTHCPSKMQPYVKTMPTWISVDDRLPETDVLFKEFLVYDNLNNKVSHDYWNNEQREWNHYQNHVTHWMLLPEFSEVMK